MGCDMSKDDEGRRKSLNDSFGGAQNPFERCWSPQVTDEPFQEWMAAQPTVYDPVPDPWYCHQEDIQSWQEQRPGDDVTADPAYKHEFSVYSKDRSEFSVIGVQNTESSMTPRHTDSKRTLSAELRTSKGFDASAYLASLDIHL